MKTEKRFELSYEPITYRGEYRGVLRGLWRMEGDKMGGPFVSHALLDKKKGRVIVAESFVYAPESKKANLIPDGGRLVYVAIRGLGLILSRI